MKDCSRRTVVLLPLLLTTTTTTSVAMARAGRRRQLNNKKNNNRQLQFSLMDHELILGADLWTNKPEILSAAPGFDGILGVDSISTKEAVIESGGTWNEDIVCANEAEKQGAAVTASASNLLQVYDCLNEPDHHDGMPVCFSWPVVPSSIKREHFRYTRSDGKVFHPNCLSSFPNIEFNERHCVVLVDDFFNRVLPAPSEDEETGERLYMKSLDIIGDLMLVGPGGQTQSAKGLSRIASWDETGYVSGPRFIGARLQPANDLGEGVGQFLGLAVGAVSMPNSANALYANYTGDLFRLRLYTSGGMTPNGVTALKPDQYSDFFSLILSTGQTVDYVNDAVVVDGTGGGRITVLGLADLGHVEGSYDDCYPEDRDNYIDIVLSVVGGDGDNSDIASVVSSIVHVQSFHKGKFLYNPGGPGTNPAPGVTYTAPSPANHLVPVIVDLLGAGLVTYCENSEDGSIGTDPNTCLSWQSQNLILQIPYGTQAGTTAPPTEPPTESPMGSVLEPTMTNDNDILHEEGSSTNANTTDDVAEDDEDEGTIPSIATGGVNDDGNDDGVNVLYFMVPIVGLLFIVVLILLVKLQRMDQYDDDDDDEDNNNAEEQYVDHSHRSLIRFVIA